MLVLIVEADRMAQLLRSRLGVAVTFRLNEASNYINNTAIFFALGERPVVEVSDLTARRAIGPLLEVLTDHVGLDDINMVSVPTNESPRPGPDCRQ